MILMTGGDKIPAEAISEEAADWLEQVWMDVQDEMDAEWRGTSLYPVDAPK